MQGLVRLLPVLFLCAAACSQSGPQTSASPRYDFVGGYPTAETVRKAHDDLDLNRAIQTYRFFYPTVSGAAMLMGTAAVGVIPNRTFGTMETFPRHVGYTLNSDTPYGPINLDLKDGPVVVELPPGPIIGAVLDVNQKWIADIGVPGPDEGKGGKHLLLPPGYKGDGPPGYYPARCTTVRVIVGVRSIPVGGDVKGAIERIRTVKVHPLNPPTDWKDPTWVDLTQPPQDTTLYSYETSLKYWEILHRTIDAEPLQEAWRPMYGELAALGIAKGKAFTPDTRMKGILEDAARIGSAQMRVQSFADRRPDCVVWKDRQWQWAALRPENGEFDTPSYLDTEAREIWFYQAIAASPAMFRRQPGSGSLYWLGLRDKNGAYLYGEKSYKLPVPQPVPGTLFWSVTVYDAETRSQVATDQGKAALRSIFELKDKTKGSALNLYFGPRAPAGHEGEWIRTNPGKGWFVYFRIYGPEAAAFDGSWKPGDFEEMK